MHTVRAVLRQRVTWAVAFALLLAWALAAAWIEAYGQADHARPAEAIVVLGARLETDGQPGPGLARRADHAAALYARGLARAVICSGGNATRGPSEAAAACARVARAGVPGAALYLEERSRSTEENALYVAALMRAHGWSSAILVTDDFHEYRAELLFRHAGVTVYPSPAQATTGRLMPWQSAPSAAREVLALLWYYIKSALGLQMTDFPCVVLC